MEAKTWGRPHAERLRRDLDEIRKELVETIQDISSDDLNWSPSPEFKMRTIKDILQEIGAMEAVTLHTAATGENLDWVTVLKSLDKESVGEILAVMSGIREKTLIFLNTVSQEKLETPFPLNQEWQGYFNAPEVEPEELIRWIIRHEYYHLGQLITYQWQRGHNPAASNEP